MMGPEAKFCAGSQYIKVHRQENRKYIRCTESSVNLQCGLIGDECDSVRVRT